MSWWNFFDPPEDEEPSFNLNEMPTPEFYEQPALSQDFGEPPTFQDVNEEEKKPTFDLNEMPTPEYYFHESGPSYHIPVGDPYYDTQLSSVYSAEPSNYNTYVSYLAA
ncbi:hypothetical protein QVD17_16366 [Tagetes erecta]|uniref:Uncharacterized protein n=1 Tax=Tagetes erecta TaxID=13708 RepID=A0AAD8KS11_TARER|nr:hypothetical protein QVD17_16366 [Tagetes erecta]